jgi:hypothetical protein
MYLMNVEGKMFSSLIHVLIYIYIIHLHFHYISIKIYFLFISLIMLILFYFNVFFDNVNVIFFAKIVKLTNNIIFYILYFIYNC